MINAWPCYWGTGGKVTFISSDWREAAVTLKLTLRTRNYAGTIFGGSIYGAVDPIYMLVDTITPSFASRSISGGVTVGMCSTTHRLSRIGRSRSAAS